MMKMIQNIEFRRTDNEFQRKMREDVKQIKQCGKVVVPADKSTNLYKMDKDTYENHLTNNITKTYKKSDETKIAEIDKAAGQIALKLGLDDRMERLQNSEAYITVKDHKENFPANPSFRLINPSKSTKGVIEWFKNVRDKSRRTFIKFDVDNFYPSITAELFNKAIDFAKQHTNITEDDLNIIMQARKTLLYHNGQPWTKKNDPSDFDVPMGSYDGGELCELVGAFMLSEISTVINKNDIGLYRDDGLGVLKRIGRPEIERLKKRIIQIFKQHGLNITVVTGLHVVDYLDVEFDLKKDLFKPYRKPDNDPLYVHKNSNHPPNILKQIPKGIERRLSEISSNEEIFKQSTPLYEEALRKSGFGDKLEYCAEPTRRRRRKRKIIWFNPPYSMNVKTNIGREFLRLLRIHFHRQHVFRKIFNKNTVKLSYSCTKNIFSIISGHNRQITKALPPASRECNCRIREQCPLDNKCLTDNIIYEGTVVSHSDGVSKDYRGLCSTVWKDRWAVHNQHMNHRIHRTKCELAKYVWDLKDQNRTFTITWKILKKVYGRMVGGACRLCTTEKLFIIEHPNKSRLLNSNCIEKCRHGDKFLLASVNSNRNRNANVDSMD